MPTELVASAYPMPRAVWLQPRWLLLPHALFPPIPPVLTPRIALITSTSGQAMSVTYEPPRPKRIYAPHALRLTRDERPKADASSFRAVHGNHICLTL
jgi:hypothetical protein